MKKALLIFVLCVFWNNTASAQVFVNGVNINELDITYCQMIGKNRDGGLSVTRVWIDYGQPSFATNIFKQQAIVGSDGRPNKFNTVIDALNFVTRNGWELVSWQVTSDKEGEAGEFVYLLKKRDGNQVK